MSELLVNTIKKADGTGSLSVPAESGTVVTTASPSLGRRNLVINGDMTINQRSWTSAAVTNAFTVDRWKVIEQTDGAITAEQSTDAPDGFKNSLKITVTSTDSSLGTTQYARVQQNIEGTNIVGLAFGTASAKTITISFYVKSSLTGTFSGCVRAIGVNRSYPFTYTISSADTWEAKSVTISGDTGGAWDVSTSGGISLFLTLCSGSDYDAPAGAWETTGASAAEGGVNVLATNGATIQWTGVQLEVGSVATPFEHRSYGEELALCQRYYQTYRFFSYSGFPSVGRVNSNPFAQFSLILPTPMRAPASGTWLGTNNGMTIVRVSDAATETPESIILFGNGYPPYNTVTLQPETTDFATGTAVVAVGTGGSNSPQFELDAEL